MWGGQCGGGDTEEGRGGAGKCSVVDISGEGRGVTDDQGVDGRVDVVDTATSSRRKGRRSV